MNYFLLIGILVIIVGFSLKLDSIIVVLVAGIVTALVAGKNLMEIFQLLGEAFLNARSMSLFFLTLPVIGLCERFGLRERAIELIQGLKVVTTGRILMLYQLIREITIALSLPLGGHPQFVRPLIEPMAQGAAESLGEKEEDIIDEIKGASAASDNFGNFFAQNIFYASPGVLLIVATLSGVGYVVDAKDVALASIPIALVVFVLSVVRFWFLDKKIERRTMKKGEKK